MSISVRFKSLIALLMTVVFLLVPSSAFASYGSDPEYPTPQIKINWVYQGKSLWCWNAVSVMLLDYYGIKMTKDEYAMFVNGHTDNVTIPAFKFKSKLNEKGIYGDNLNSAASWNQIKASIDKGYPIVAFKEKKKDGFGHTYIINGYYTKKIGGVDVQYVIYNNPAEGEDALPYNEFNQDNPTWNWTGSWLNVNKIKR
ncbi:C39 family peptidase [Brevibacillus choshinensis]|uniref:C39 family peptidase n=1 Tax=Brevibacillus choshinensis TaxID=54911 RepID=A0ABX7FSP9_BRECH|nr:C39 family peptidase [Brevibacillus choshinensis]QRG68619.1 C39 family peptidase [Brevibacillus choshinensis]